MSDFIQHCRAHGLIVDHVIADQRWHRVPTENKPRKKNGAYLFDGRTGLCIDFATMVKCAGWRSGEQMMVSREQYRALRFEARASEAKRHQQAAARAHALIKSAKLVIPQPTVRRRGGYVPGVMAHPYLAAKGFPAHPGLVCGDVLVIPMHDLSGTLVGAQTIDASGRKLFLPGTKARGAVHRLGVRGRVVLVEGYATGLSVQAALKRMYIDAQVLVTFSANNLIVVAAQVGNELVVADCDESGTGEKAAKETGLSWVMPEVGDANDLHQREGLDAVVTLIRRALETV